MKIPQNTRWYYFIPQNTRWHFITQRQFDWHFSIVRVCVLFCFISRFIFIHSYTKHIVVNLVMRRLSFNFYHIYHYPLNFRIAHCFQYALRSINHMIDENSTICDSISYLRMHLF